MASSVVRDGISSFISFLKPDSIGCISAVDTYSSRSFPQWSFFSQVDEDHRLWEIYHRAFLQLKDITKHLLALNNSFSLIFSLLPSGESQQFPLLCKLMIDCLNLEVTQLRYWTVWLNSTNVISLHYSNCFIFILLPKLITKLEVVPPRH